MQLRDLPPTLQKLATLGDTGLSADWIDYRALGIGQEHISDLIPIIEHTTDYWEDALDDSDPEGWIPVHAWRALGQLQAVEAIPALLALLPLIEDIDSDLIQEELPEVFQAIGPAAVEPLSPALLDPTLDTWSRLAVAEGLTQIANAYPETRVEVVDLLIRALEDYTQQPPTFNGFIICYLADLKAIEAYALVEEAYISGLVDESILGDWEDFQINVGLLDQRISPARPRFSYDFSEGIDDEADSEPEIVSTLEIEYGKEPAVIPLEGKKNKHMRKQAHLSPKKNFKKKKKKK